MATKAKKKAPRKGVRVKMLKSKVLKTGRVSTITYVAGQTYEVPEALAREWVDTDVAIDPLGKMVKPEPPAPEPEPEPEPTVEVNFTASGDAESIASALGALSSDQFSPGGGR